MARIIPDRFPTGRLHSERQVYEALCALSGDWTVLYSVGWQSKRYGRQGDGEADFLLLHSKGFLVIEVKGGEIRLKQGKWFSQSAKGDIYEISDPFQQALDSRKALG